MKRVLLKAAGLAVILFAAAQFVQPDRANVPSDPSASFAHVTKAPPELAAAVDRACGNCHSNQTTWPWYSRISPVSWLVASDVQRGRRHLNFSEWNLFGPEASAIKLSQACREVRNGKMPLWYYTLVHSEAKLSQTEIATLCGGKL